MNKAKGYVCKCVKCGNKGNTNTFYQYKYGGKNMYFCNEQEYLSWKLEKECKDKILEYMADIWLMDDKKMLPRILLKQINDLANIYNYETILRTMERCRSNLEYWMRLEGKFTRENGSIDEFGKSSYCMAIIRSNINSVYKEIKATKRQMEREQRKSVDFKTDVMKKLEQKAKIKKENNGILDFI